MTDECDYSERPFYELGYTDPDTAVELRAQRLNDQDAVHYSPPNVPHRTGHVRDYESDRDHQPPTGKLDLTDEDHKRNRRGIELAREALRPSQERSYLERANGDANLAAALRRAHTDRRLRGQGAS